ncbi:transposase [Streptomyces californicus]|uniref:transposase n=1 Tax=Streptomyces californicus TaxID=67351 RepID=UPI0037B18885
MALLITPGQRGDAPQMIEVLDRIRVPRPLGGQPRTRPAYVSGDKAHSSRRNRRYLRRRRIKHTIPRTEGPAGQPSAQRQRGRQARRLRPRALPATQRGRADHQPAQELPCGRHPL